MPPKVYYLDDEPQLCRVFQRYLEGKGLCVRTFSQASAAIEACLAEPPDILFVDYRLGETTGDKVAEAVDARIKKVLVTGELALDNTEQFCATLRKPFRLQQAFELVASLVETERATESTPCAAAKPEDPG